MIDRAISDTEESEAAMFTPNKAPGDQQGETANKAKVVPESFEDWLKQGNDAIDLDRTESACQWFDNKAKEEANPFQ